MAVNVVVGPTGEQVVVGMAGQLVKVVGGTGPGTGDVVGPSSATDGHLAVFDGATGKVIKDGGAVPSGGGTGTITPPPAAASWTGHNCTIVDAGQTVTIKSTSGAGYWATTPLPNGTTGLRLKLQAYAVANASDYITAGVSDGTLTTSNQAVNGGRTSLWCNLRGTLGTIIVADQTANNVPFTPYWIDVDWSGATTIIKVSLDGVNFDAFGAALTSQTWSHAVVNAVSSLISTIGTEQIQILSMAFR